MEVVELMRRMMGVQARYTDGWDSYHDFFVELVKDMPDRKMRAAEVTSLLGLGGDVPPPAGAAKMVITLADLNNDGVVGEFELRDYLQAVFCASDMAQNVVLFGRPIGEMKTFATYEQSYWLEFE